MPGLLKKVVRQISRVKHNGTPSEPSNRHSLTEIKHQVQSHRADFLAQFELSDKCGLEIGPFARPVFTRDAYPNILYADQMDERFLKSLARKSKKLNEEDVVPLDYVLKGKRLDDLITHTSLDFVFCAHVLEHIPDIISALQSIERILKPGGLFLFFYPDRRFTYDIDRPATTLEQIQSRHARRIKRPDSETVLEHFLNNRHVDAARIWYGLDRAIGSLKHTPEKAIKFSELARESYVDVHCNVFSDRELIVTAETLRTLGLIRLQVHKFGPTQSPSNEFHVALIKP